MPNPSLLLDNLPLEPFEEIEQQVESKQDVKPIPTSSEIPSDDVSADVSIDAHCDDSPLLYGLGFAQVSTSSPFYGESFPLHDDEFPFWEILWVSLKASSDWKCMMHRKGLPQSHFQLF